MTPNPFEKVEARRVELIRLAGEKERLLVKRIADLRQQALNIRTDADRLARAHHLNKAETLRAEASQIEATVRTLANVDLPQLKIEQEQIRQMRHPELAALLIAANSKARDSQVDRERAAFNALTEAKSAFYGHLASLATAETIDFARAVFAAETAADVEHCEAGQNLLTLLGPKAAA